MKKFLVIGLAFLLINSSYQVQDISDDDEIEQQIESYKSLDSSFNDDNDQRRRFQFNIDFGTDVKVMSKKQLDEFVKSLDVNMKCKRIDFLAKEPTVVILECVDFYDYLKKRRFAVQFRSSDKRRANEIQSTLKRGVRCRRINYIEEDVTMECDDNSNRRLSFLIHPLEEFEENSEITY